MLIIVQLLSKTGFSCRYQLLQRWKVGATEPAPRVPLHGAALLPVPLAAQGPHPQLRASSFRCVVGFNFRARFCKAWWRCPPSPWHHLGAHPVPGICSSSSTASLESKATRGRCSWRGPSCSPFAFPRAERFGLSCPPAPRAELSPVQHERLLGRTWTSVQSLASIETVRICCTFMLLEAGGC